MTFLRGAVAVFLASVIALAGLRSLVGPEDGLGFEVANWVLIVTSVVSFNASLLGVLLSRSGEGSPVPVTTQIAALGSLSARWGTSALADGDHWQLPWVFRLRAGPVEPSPIEITRSGSTRDLVPLLADAVRPVVVLGESGVGKSTLAGLVQRHLAGQVRAGISTPVAVRLHVSGWRPNLDLVSWAAVKVSREAGRRQRALAARPRQLRPALADGQVRLLLDGVDELSPPRRADLVLAIGRRNLPRVVLFTQERALTDAQLASLSCDVVQLLPMGGSATGDVLAAAVPGPMDPGWAAVVAALRDGSMSTETARVLGTPLFLSLAQEAIRHGQPPPAGLPDGRSSVEVERHLLAGAVDAALRHAPGDASSTRYVRRRRRWLRTSAEMLDRLGGEDVVWWDLPRFVPWAVQAVVAGLVAGVVLMSMAVAQDALAPFLGLPDGYVVDMDVSAVGAAAVAVVVAALGDQRSGARPRRWYRSAACASPSFSPSSSSSSRPSAKGHWAGLG